MTCPTSPPRKWQSQDLNPDCLAPESVPPVTLLWLALSKMISSASFFFNFILLLFYYYFFIVVDFVIHWNFFNFKIKKKCIYWLPRWCSDNESVVKAGDARDVGSVPGLGRSPGVGNGNPLRHSCLENPMDRGAWRATVHSVVKSWTWLSTQLIYNIVFISGVRL